MQYVLNVAFTVPAIIYIDKWGRRPMLLVGLAMMGFWLFLVGGLQGGFGHWGDIEGDRVWVIEGHDSITKGIIVCSYFFVCRYAFSLSLKRNLTTYKYFFLVSPSLWALYHGHTPPRSTH